MCPVLFILNALVAFGPCAHPTIRSPRSALDEVPPLASSKPPSDRLEVWHACGEFGLAAVIWYRSPD